VSDERVSADDAAGVENVAPAPRDIEQLTIVCAWCKKVMHQGEPGAETIAGICETCGPKTAGFIELGPDGKAEFLA
jgi:hypothetical protein